jgi:predicted RNase H-like HicB family nuclease
MSAKQKRPSKSQLSRPFSRETWFRARELASRYQVVVRLEDGEYFGRGLEMPGVMDDGKSPDRCVKNTQTAMAVAVAVMLERGQTPPLPVSEAPRSEQVNIRLTAEEKLLMEQSARAQGFRGISDYMRSLALSGK